MIAAYSQADPSCATWPAFPGAGAILDCTGLARNVSRGVVDNSMQDRRQHFADLIIAVARQDKAAFAELFAYFAPRIKTMMIKVGATEQRAEDVAQDAMLLVWRKAPLFDAARAGPSAWIFTIAKNARIDALRRERRSERMATELGRQPEPDATLSDDDIMTAESEQLTRQCLLRLSPEQQRVVTLSFFEDKAHPEIAEALGIPLGTVKSRLRLALKHLKTMLEDTQ
jgi:RNA polymerase sigma-70 factor, ECF subfamily